MNEAEKKEIKKECITCEHCIYIGEGGYMCLHTNKIVMDDFEPLLEYYKTNCKRWRENG